MINNTYGEFSENQMEEYKKKLHDKIYFLLLYEDPKTKDNFVDVNVDRYIYFLLLEINGLNHILHFPMEIVEILSILNTAKSLRKKENYNFRTYRKLILDAQALVDDMFKGGVPE